VPSQSDIYGGLTTIFRDLFLRDSLVLSPGLTAADIEGWDSFRHMEIVLAAEDRWGIRFGTRELDGLRCVDDLVRVIAAKTA
jgi:acyl carrier protein